MLQFLKYLNRQIKFTIPSGKARTINATLVAIIALVTFRSPCLGAASDGTEPSNVLLFLLNSQTTRTVNISVINMGITIVTRLLIHVHLFSFPLKK